MKLLVRLWFPIWKSKGYKYDISKDEHINQDYLYIVSLGLDKIIAGYQLRFQGNWAPVNYSGIKRRRYGLSTTIGNLKLSKEA